MPNVDQAAKAWELGLAGRVGRVVQGRRKALNMTAQDLAERTRELGYPVSRQAISKIEGNFRTGKLDVAELFILAVALDMPPALLLFPSFPSGTVELLPDDREATGDQGVRWLAGDRPLPARRIDRERGISEEPVNVGTQLVAAVRERDLLSREHLHADLMATTRPCADPDETSRWTRLADGLENQLATVNARIADLYEQLGVGGAGDA
jgi:transcriptional regulator with XRE-family HTH domain